MRPLELRIASPSKTTNQRQTFFAEATCCSQLLVNMLSRAVTRSLRTPGFRKPSATLRIASSTVFSRSMARGNRPNQNNHRQSESSKYNSSNFPQQQKGASFNTPLSGNKTNDKSGNFSRKQEEFNRDASPLRNAVPPRGERDIEQELHSAAQQETQRQEEAAGFSSKQDEFETTSPSQNTAPQDTSPSAVDPAEVPPQNRPLPDLRGGIPSTLEYETTGSSKSHHLNLTEADEPIVESGGGRGRGELPASAYISSSEKRRLKVANYMYAMFALSCVGGTVYLGRNWDDEEEEKKHPNAPSGWAIGLMWARAKARLGDQINYYNEPAFPKLLPDVDPIFERPYTLIVSLEDLLIHSEWTREHGWRLAKRPGVDYFLRYLSQYYELVIWTSQQSALAEPVIRKLDPYHIVTWPLFREATYYENGEYVKVQMSPSTPRTC